MDLVYATQIEEELRHACAELDPDAVPLADAVAMYESLARTEKLVSGARLRLSRKVEEAGVAGRTGDRSAADVISRVNGTSRRAAHDELETSKRLRSQPATEEAVAKGDLSREQATAVSDAADADPSEERRLLEEARTKPVSELRKTCERVKANAHPDPDARRRAIHAGRFARTWTDREGGRNLHLRGLAEDLADLEAKVTRYQHAAFEAARTSGRRDTPEHYAYDGWLGLLRDAGGDAPKGASRTDTKTFVHIDLDTLRRGRTTSGSVCHIDRIGPVDVDWVRSLLGETFLVAVLRDGHRIVDVVHLGRDATALQRSFKEAGGVRCEVPDCTRTTGLELDHRADWATTHRTTVEELVWHCSHHHDLKTHHAYRLLGPPGDRRWVAPDGTVLSRDRPPPGDPDPPPAADAEPATLFA